ncbi:MAG: carboxypeptidase-like regulatory domain-containing protein, partial [Ferruginibacter sp.]
MTAIKRFIQLLAFMLICFSSFGQERIVTGMVVTQDDSPIEGVSVTIKGQSTGTQTNQEGKFSIKALKGQVLEFSSVGYDNKKVTVGESNYFKVTLSSVNKLMDDIVVVGYGTQKRGNVTGAVSTVDIKKSLQGRPIADIGRGLQGAASGLSVVIPSGEVGSDPIIKIRGQMTSFRGSSEPLILLDNVEIPSIQIVNPNDIASITILKDAASASIYGAKASNGVILITSKKGSSSSKPQVSYSGNFSWQNVWKDLNMGTVNALKYTMDAMDRVGISTPVGAFYYVDRASYLKSVEWEKKYGGSIGPNDPTVFGRDWFTQDANNKKMGVRTYNAYDYMVKEWAPTQQHNITVGQ